jgi:hypothetical protein
MVRVRCASSPAGSAAAGCSSARGAAAAPSKGAAAAPSKGAGGGAERRTVL